MDPAIVNTLITSSASIVVAALGLMAGKRDIAKMSNRKIYELQLNSLFAPMDKLLELPLRMNPQDILDELLTLIKENYTIVPPIILYEIQRLSLLETISNTSFEKLKEMTASYFNWLRKYLHYPYDREKIIKNCSPVGNKWNRIYRFFESVFFMLLIGYLVVVVASIFAMQYLNEQELMIYILLPFAITYIGMRIVAWIILKDKRMDLP